MTGPVVFCGIAPHPPLLVPEVGGERIREVADSKRSLEEFSRRVVSTDPDTVVVISPHSPLDPRYFTARAEDELRGDFRDFNARTDPLVFPNDRDLLKAVAAASEERGLWFRELNRPCPLDHGALVPLYYLNKAGWTGAIAVFGFTNQSIEDHLSFGRAITAGASAIRRRIAIVASGDLSHRLIVGGPYEYEPTAHRFDEQIVNAISQGCARKVLEVDDGLRMRAGECGYRSILVALGSVDQHIREHQVLSYEGPFGVGYMVAVLVDAMTGDSS